MSIKNYIKITMINVDTNLYHFSHDIEINNPNLIDNDEEIKNRVKEIIDFESTNLTSSENKKDFYEKAKDYLYEREPYDFFYVGKKNIKESINEEKGRSM